MKTIRQKSKEYSVKLNLEGIIEYGALPYIEDGYKAGYREAMRWIDPKEEMPEIGEFVQVKCKRDSVWHDHDKVILDRFGNKKFEYMPYYVIGWRPIEEGGKE